MDELVYIGKTVSTFGIKGELKVISDFEYKDRVYKESNKVLINNISHTISGVRYHKNYILLKIDNYNNINDILEYVGYNIYIKREDINLKEDEYLLRDLINAQVIDDNNKYLGKVKDIIKNNLYPILEVKADKSILIPLIKEYIIKYDKDKNIIYTKNASSLEDI